MPVGYVEGKMLAAKALAVQARFFSNWQSVFCAYREGRELPPLRLRSGLTLYHGQNDDIWSLFKEIFIDRCYCRRNFYVPQSEHCVMDCGANVGTFAVYLQSVAPGIRVNCFEPASSTRSRLQKNITANGLADRVHVYPFAIFDREGELMLSQAAFAGSSSVFDSGSVGAAVESVRCITLAEAVNLCNCSTIDLLKIDVEGAELVMLEATDANDPSLWQKVSRVVMEYHEAIRPGCRDRLLSVLRRRYSKVDSWPTSPGGELGIIQAAR